MAAISASDSAARRMPPSSCARSRAISRADFPIQLPEGQTRAERQQALQLHARQRQRAHRGAVVQRRHRARQEARDLHAEELREQRRRQGCQSKASDFATEHQAWCRQSRPRLRLRLRFRFRSRLRCRLDVDFDFDDMLDFDLHPTRTRYLSPAEPVSIATPMPTSSCQPQRPPAPERRRRHGQAKVRPPDATSPDP